MKIEVTQVNVKDAGEEGHEQGAWFRSFFTSRRSGEVYDEDGRKWHKDTWTSKEQISWNDDGELCPDSRIKGLKKIIVSI